MMKHALLHRWRGGLSSHQFLWSLRPACPLPPKKRIFGAVIKIAKKINKRHFLWLVGTRSRLWLHLFWWDSLSKQQRRIQKNLLLTQCALSAKLAWFALFPAAVSLQASLRSSSQRLSILATSLSSAQTDLILRQFLLRHLAVKRQTHDQYQYLRFVHFLSSGTLPETYTFSY